MKETLFKAQALLKHAERAELLRATIALQMRLKLDAGDISTRAYDFPENNELSELEGIMDRMRRDFVSALVKEPKQLVDLCKAIIERDARPPQTLRGFPDAPVFIDPPPAAVIIGVDLARDERAEDTRFTHAQRAAVSIAERLTDLKNEADVQASQ